MEAKELIDNETRRWLNNEPPPDGIFNGMSPYLQDLTGTMKVVNLSGCSKCKKPSEFKGREGREPKRTAAIWKGSGSIEVDYSYVTITRDDKYLLDFESEGIKSDHARFGKPNMSSGAFGMRLVRCQKISAGKSTLMRCSVFLTSGNK